LLFLNPRVWMLRKVDNGNAINKANFPLLGQYEKTKRLVLAWRRIIYKGKNEVITSLY